MARPLGRDDCLLGIGLIASLKGAVSANVRAGLLGSDGGGAPTPRYPDR